MIKKVDITNLKLAEEVLNIQIPSYKIEAEIIDFYDIPPLKDTVYTLQQCGETFFGYYVKEELCGVISIKVENGIIDIHRLMVHPKHFKKGIAKILLDFIENANEGFETIIVSTGSKNTPAVTFYLKNGFSKTEEISITERLSITSFKKDLI
ncbi:GNAT family N-acetyltransferase [Lysinibacillus sphaericus]|uniref:GNAT family N-acetyltransferase n=1 Tax=Lysinibacillus sphaericus TaxID=1421 RepID=UPI002162B7FE|nr:GNAT family N-acetyltransferase [Lysinibacillus sphaericus]MCS1384528.1 GNAT family N-acetyltransferase [Lysinibacillus sphaericus]